MSWLSCAGEPFGVRVHAFRNGSADRLSCAEPRRGPAYTRMEPGREHCLREGYRLAIRRMVGRRTSKLPFPAVANFGAQARSWAADDYRRERYLMPAAMRPDVTVLSPACPRRTGAQTLPASFNRPRMVWMYGS